MTVRNRHNVVVAELSSQCGHQTDDQSSILWQRCGDWGLDPTWLNQKGGAYAAETHVLNGQGSRQVVRVPRIVNASSAAGDCTKPRRMRISIKRRQYNWGTVAYASRDEPTDMRFDSEG
jgi:hypothetical protein